MSGETQVRDCSIDPQKGSLLSLPFFVGLAAIVLIPHYLIWGENALKTALNSLSLPWMLAALVAVIIAHEGIHGFTWMLAARLQISDIRYGILWSALAPYAHPKVPITAGAYRIGAAMPGLVMGALPSLIGLAIGSGVLSGWGAFLLAVASGDLLVLVIMRSVPSAALVRDHPTRFGCEVIESRN
jgi:Putative zincin peptidase